MPTWYSTTHQLQDIPPHTHTLTHTHTHMKENQLIVCRCIQIWKLSGSVQSNLHGSTTRRSQDIPPHPCTHALTHTHARTHAHTHMHARTHTHETHLSETLVSTSVGLACTNCFFTSVRFFFITFDPSLLTSSISTFDLQRQVAHKTFRIIL